MSNINFFATSIASEINLNQISQHFGIPRQLKWEDVLILREAHLKGVIPHEEGKAVYLFHFGCMVGVNLEKHEMNDVYNYLRKIDPQLKANDPFTYSEGFSLEIDEEQEPTLTNNKFIVPKHLNYYNGLIALVLAKSVALDRTEQSLERLLDDIEMLLDDLDGARLNISDAKISKLSAKILRFKYNTISYLMVLDKPDVTWSVEGAEDVYLQLQDLFDIPERYDNIKHKAETIMDITEVFTLLSQSRRGHRLEWIIILLIAFEIVWTIVEKLVS